MARNYTALIVNKNKHTEPIESFFRDIGYDLVFDPTEGTQDLVVFHGNCDNIINPFLCGQKSLLPGRCWIDNSLDRHEVSVLKTIPSWMPKIGLGRGAHLLNAMLCNGYTTYNVDNHEMEHEAYCMVTKTVFDVPSRHEIGLALADYSSQLLMSNKSTTFTLNNTINTIDHRNGWKDVEAFYNHTEGVLGFIPELGIRRDVDDLLVRYMDFWNKGELK